VAAFASRTAVVSTGENLEDITDDAVVRDLKIGASPVLVIATTSRGAHAGKGWIAPEMPTAT